MAAALIKRDCQIACATDGDAARGILAAGGIDICVVEPHLPGTSGVQLCAWIYSACLKPAPYVILLTKTRKSADSAPTYKPGADEYFAKPVDPDRLGARIHAVAQNLGRQRRVN